MRHNRAKPEAPEDLAMVIEELLERIARLFAGVPRPSGITKTVARALDDEWHLTERRRTQLYLQDSETRWEQLTIEQVIGHDDIFAFLDADGYLFYLPAFMSFVLRRFPFCGHNHEDRTIYACGHGDERFRVFSDVQLKCVIDFLRFCSWNEGSFDTSRAAKAADLPQSRLHPLQP